jgi:hypothetical protein
MYNIRTEFKLSSLSEVVRLGLVSDCHFGASSLDKKALKKDFDRMAALGCRIGINGDVFDAILPSDVKRFDLRAVDPELMRMCTEGGWLPLDGAIELAARFLEPYAHLIEFIGIGNHEGHVGKHHHVQLVPQLIAILRERTGHSIKYGGWCGYWNVALEGTGTKKTGFTIYRHHGAGGAAPATKGIIDFERMMAWQGDVDGLWIGHKHNRFAVVNRKMTLDRRTMTSKERDVHCIMTGSYLDTYGLEKDTKPSYAVGWNVSPQSKGGAIIELSQMRTANELITQARVLL